MDDSRKEGQNQRVSKEALSLHTAVMEIFVNAVLERVMEDWVTIPFHVPTVILLPASGGVVPEAKRASKVFSLVLL